MSSVLVTAPSSGDWQQAERRGDERKAALEVVSRRSSRVGHRKLLPVLAACVLSGSLFAVVIGHAELAQGQIKLSALQAEITAAQATHRNAVVSVANLENPARIVREAEKSLHMETPSVVEQLPYVTLDKPLPVPSVAPASSATVGASGTSSASAGSGG